MNVTSVEPHAKKTLRPRNKTQMYMAKLFSILLVSKGGKGAERVRKGCGRGAEGVRKGCGRGAEKEREKYELRMPHLDCCRDSIGIPHFLCLIVRIMCQDELKCFFLLSETKHVKINENVIVLHFWFHLVKTLPAIKTASSDPFRTPSTPPPHSLRTPSWVQKPWSEQVFTTS